MEYLLGVDAGTSSTRAAVYSAVGELLGEGRGFHSVQRPRFGYAEQDAEDWWRAFCEAVRQALESSGVAPKRLAAVAITHQRNTFCLLDARQQPVRPAILWLDMRARAQIDRVSRELGMQRVYQQTGFPPSPVSLYKVLWVAEEEPEIWKRTDRVCLVPDYLIMRLAGELVTASGSASQTGCLNIAAPTHWAADLLEDLGIPLAKWVPQILPGMTVAARVSREGALASGLSEGLPIVLAAGDQNVGTLGAGVVREGMAGINGGTSCTLETISSKLILDSQLSYFLEVSPLPDTYLPETAIMSGGGALMDWFSRNLLGGGIAPSKSVEEIYRDIAKTPPGSEGLLLVPYLAGAMGPYWDPYARGFLFGLTLDHQQGHVARALVEGLALESRRQLASLELGLGTHIQEVRMYGGSARSETWNSIFADVLGVPVVTTDTCETGALGAAICAAVGVGIYPDGQRAVKAMVRPKTYFQPDAERHHIYSRLFNEVYAELYERVQELSGRVGAITDCYH